jgi:hypothetical protein
MIDDQTEQVLLQIFGRASGWADGSERPDKMSPGFPDLVAFAKVLSLDPDEESLQQFLATHPRMLLGLFGEGGDSDQAFLTKPPIGTRFNGDFAVLNVSQGGCAISLVEIEPSKEPIFTKKLTPARRLQGAIGQVQNWAQWIDRNKPTFVREMVDLAKRVPLYPAEAPNHSVRLWEPDHIEQAWLTFGGFDSTVIRYAIIIGRWARITDEERQRLLFLNQDERRKQIIYTYDQVARRSYDRPVT